MAAYRWEVRPPAPAGVLAAFGPMQPLTGQLLFNRGLLSPEAARARLATRGAAWHDPLLLPDMERAVAAVLAARQRGDRVVAYGDFDADGITGTALLVQGLRNAGVNAGPYIPHREREGYGLNTSALTMLHQEGARLVISVDTGTSAVEEITEAANLGLGVIALDHHTIPPELPPAVALVNPHRRENRYPFPDLAGVGVAFKFLQAVYAALGRDPGELEGGLDLVAIGTVGDLAPLEGENRWLVSQGLELMNSRPRAGLAALMQRAGLAAGGVAAGDLGFVVAPRINAMGRLDHALASYQILTTADAAEAAALAARLETTNQERRRLTREAVELALATVAGGDGDAPLTLVGGPEFPAGIIGLVASRLAEERYRPAVVYAEAEGFSRGSARSIPGFNIAAALAECHDLFERHGGHEQAAGFTIRTERLPALRERLLPLAAARLAGRNLERVLDIEAATPLRGLLGQPMKLLARLEPFGTGNPQPVFMTANVRVVDSHSMGSDGSHLQMTVGEDDRRWRAVGFGMGARITEVRGPLDLAYTLETDRWQGEERVQLRLRDFRPAVAAAP